MKEITAQQQQQLREALPQEALTVHPTKSFLTSIKPIYIIERLNQVFGIGSWKTKVEHHSTDLNSGMVVLKVIFEIPEYGIYHEEFAGNDNGGASKKGFDLGDAFKGAKTDALTKIASFLEIGIDVFKDKSTTVPNPSQPQQPSDETANDDNKAWLNENSPEYDKIVKRIAKGEVITLATIRQHFKVSKKVAEALNKIGIQ